MEGALESGWSALGQFREIFQTGAVRVDVGHGFAELAHFSVLVRPTINPELSNYFTDLTGITNQNVAQTGVSLADGLAAFADFVGADVILTHGRDDLVVGEDCALKNMGNPFADADWRDINPPLRAITDKRLMSADLPEFFGFDRTENAHDALADARVLAHLQ